MNQGNLNKCDEFGELISAMLDNELTLAERSSLDEHLATCESCRQLGATFADLELLVRSPIEFNESQISSTLRGTFSQHTAADGTVMRKGRYGSSTRTFVAAAIVLIGFVGFVRMVQHQPQLSPVADDLPIARPLQNLSVISHQQRLTQEVTRETLQWELRTMKLELDQLNLSEDQSRRLHQRLTELMNQLEFPKDQFAQPIESGETI